MKPSGRPAAWFGSTTLRLAVTLALTQIVTLALGLGVMHALTRQTLTDEARIAAEVASDDLRDALRSGGGAGLLRAIGNRLAAPDDPDFVVLLRGADGAIKAGNLAGWPSPASAPQSWRVGALTRAGSRAGAGAGAGAGSGPGAGAGLAADRTEPAGYVIAALPDGQSLLTGEMLRDHGQLNRASAQSFGYAMLAGLLIAALASWAILRVLERRIDHFGRAARDFASGRLNTRIALQPDGDAFGRLGIAINAMLERIETLVAELRAVTDSMAHDLRSPVARIRSSLERSLGAARDDSARSALADAIDETDGLQRLLDTALEISRTEAGIGRSQFTGFDLTAMLHDLAEVYGPLAEEQGFTIEVAAPPATAVTAHRELLFRAISNLIDNALKYADQGSLIQLAFGPPSGGHVVLSVSDDGPGIAPTDHDEALRRFGRLDPARTRSGAGLGMALVATIASLHGGSVMLGQASPRGLRVSLTLPIAAAG